MYKIHRLGLFLCAGTLLGKQHCLDVGQDTTLSDGDSSKKLVQLLVISESTYDGKQLIKNLNT